MSDSLKEYRIYKNAISTMKLFIDKATYLIDNHDYNPALKSIADNQLKESPYEILIFDALQKGSISIISARDHLLTYCDSLIEPAKFLAPFTCVRGFIESCSHAIHLLEPEIEAKTRVGRAFSFRFQELEEQRKFWNATDNNEESKKTRIRIDEVEQEALSIGFLPILDKNNRRIGIGSSNLSRVELIQTTLDIESQYRLLSGVAHGNYWAMTRFGFKVVESQEIRGKGIRYFEPNLSLDIILFATEICYNSFAKLLLKLWSIYGWEKNEITSLLEEIADELIIKPEYRFWRI